MIHSVTKTNQQIKVIESAKDQLGSIKGVCDVIYLDAIDIVKIKRLEILDEQMGCKMIGRKYNAGIRRVLSSDVVLSFLVDKGYDWPVNTIKVYHKGKMIGEDSQDQHVIKQYSERNDSFVMGNIIFYDKESLKNSYTDDPVCMIVIEQPCPMLETLWGISDAVIGIPSSYTHDYLQLKIHADKKQMLGSFLAGFNIDQKAFALSPIDGTHIYHSQKGVWCQLPL